MESYNAWLGGDIFDADTKAELQAIAQDKKEIEDRFYKSLSFGTGGLRGILGAGTNRMNQYTVGKATQGLANYLLEQKDTAGGVVIAHDSRRMSAEFCRQTALVLNANGIETYIFDSLRPTPVLSFAVRHLNCAAGIVITASHNPKEYNGYKVYGRDGGQVTYPRDEAIIRHVGLVTGFDQIKTMGEAEATAQGLFHVLDAELDDAYMQNVMAQRIHPEVCQSTGSDLSIVYTPLHGAGNVPVRRALKEAGFTNIHVVPQQEMPDPNFTTVSYPNPEDPKAFTLALELAKTVNATCIFATDPDSDRLGCMVQNNDGEYVVLTGNMIGTLMAEYILSQRQQMGKLPANGALISTVVSSPLSKTIAQAYGVTYFEVLTGFKYIGEKMKEFEETGAYTYLFGFEESNGVLTGTYARDKDAVSGVLLMCEMAAYYKTQGKTLWDALQAMYAKYGYYMETVETITLKGVDGLAAMGAMMSGLRQNPPKTVTGKAVVCMKDFQNQTATETQTGAVAPIELPVSDVLHFALEGGDWFCVRPSGTEPKIKIYMGVKGTDGEEAKKRLAALAKDVMERLAN